MKSYLVVIILTIIFISGCSKEPETVSTLDVDFMTEDSINIKGTLYFEENEGTLPGVILAHQFLNDKKSWAGFAKKLAPLGYVILAFDFRDWGESSGTKADIPNHYKDVIAAAEFFSQLKMVDPNRIASVGAFIGGMASIVAASEDTTIKAVIAISTPHGWQGSEPMEVVGKISPRPVLIIAAETEPVVSLRSAEQNYLRAGEPREWKVIKTNRMGTDIFYSDKKEELENTIIDFLNRKLKPETLSDSTTHE